MFMMTYDTEYGESGEIELYARTFLEAEEEADRFAENNTFIESYSVRRY